MHALLLAFARERCRLFVAPTHSTHLSRASKEVLRYFLCLVTLGIRYLDANGASTSAQPSMTAAASQKQSW